MPKLIVDVEVTDSAKCSGCRWVSKQHPGCCDLFRTMNGEWREMFPTTLPQDSIGYFLRLPACIAGEADLTRLVEAVKGLVENMGIELDDKRMCYLCAQVYRDDLSAVKAALAPFEEARHG